jgi:hypothetical protein
MGTINQTPDPVLFQYVAGDNGPDLFAQYSEDITDYTIEMQINQPDGTVFSVPATIIDAPAGEFKFGPFPAGALVNGLQNAPIKLTDSLNNLTTVPNIYLNVIRG